MRKLTLGYEEIHLAEYGANYKLTHINYHVTLDEINVILIFLFVMA